MSQTAQIVIANQAGAPYRAAVNDMLSALNTSFAGTTPPTVSEAYMNWLDTSVTPNVLKRRNSSDTAWETHPLQALADANKVTADAAMPRSGGNYTGPANANKGADIASSATTDIFSATGEYVVVTGTTTITALGTAQAGAERVVRFSGVLTLTHNATSLILPTGANIITAVGDVAVFRSEGSGNTRCVSYTRADGTALVGQRMTLTATVATTSGTVVDLTGIPSWAKRITILPHNVSTNGNNNYLLQLGTSSGVENTGYSGYINSITGASVVTVASTAGVLLSGAAGTATSVSGEIRLTNQSGNIWQITGTTIRNAENTNNIIVSNKTLAAVLDRVRITTTTGVDTFDAGSVSLLIEGY